MMNTTTINYKQFLAVALLALAAFPGAYLLYKVSSKNQQKIAVFNTIGKESVIETVKQISAQGSNVSETLKEQLNTEFSQLLAQLQVEFPLAPGVWQKALAELESLKKNDPLLTNKPVVRHQKGDTPLVMQVRELLASYNIDPAMVKIETMDNPKNSSYAFAGQCVVDDKVQHYIQLNLAQLPKQTPAVQEALLRHEIMHLLNYDPLTFAIIEAHLQDGGITAKEFWANDTFSAMNKLIEYRADLMASGDSVETAQALKDAFTEHLKRFNDIPDCRTHPSCKQRYAALDNLIQYVHAESALA